AGLEKMDIDRSEIGRHYPVELGIHADAALTLEALLRELPPGSRPPWAPTEPTREPRRLPGLDLVGPLKEVLPKGTILVADITRLTYILLAEFPVYEPRSFLH